MTKHTGRAVMALSALSALSVLSGALLPVLGAGPAHAVRADVHQLEDAISIMLTADENRSGYSSAAFPHWNKGRDTTDKCSTREEVLIAEAIEAPEVADADCAVKGGKWLSYYDEQTVTNLKSLDVDHVVPLAEAWGSGASAWSPARREAYANDQDAPATLTAVNKRVKREKGDRDLTGWLPATNPVQCRYIADWVGTKLRWGLSTDKEELEVLKLFADGPCESTVILYTPAPA
ncbi:HNH endonuclease family protein [Streptomyces sp. NPDC055078]